MNKAEEWLFIRGITRSSITTEDMQLYADEQSREIAKAQRKKCVEYISKYITAYPLQILKRTPLVNLKSNQEGE